MQRKADILQQWPSQEKENSEQQNQWQREKGKEKEGKGRKGKRKEERGKRKKERKNDYRTSASHLCISAKPFFSVLKKTSVISSALHESIKVNTGLEYGILIIKKKKIK